MFRFILLTILIIEILLGLAMAPAFAATKEERELVYKETSTICSIYLTKCTVKEVEDQSMWAVTTPYGKIRVSSGLAETLTEAQLRGVLYHEAGHVVFRHVEKTTKYLEECMPEARCNKNYLEAFKKQNEIQADRFSVLAMVLTGKPEGLSEALKIITPPKDFYKTHPTHPSTAERIYRIRRLLNEI